MDEMKKAANDLAAYIRKKTNNGKSIADFARATAESEEHTPQERAQARAMLKELAERGVYPSEKNGG